MQDDEREVLDLAPADSEDGAFWTASLRSLRSRDLAGVRLDISDAHEGLKGAIASVLLGSAWQRCKVRTQRPLAHPQGQRRDSACGRAHDLRPA